MLNDADITLFQAKAGNPMVSLKFYTETLFLLYLNSNVYCTSNSYLDVDSMGGSESLLKLK